MKTIFFLIISLPLLLFSCEKETPFHEGEEVEVPLTFSIGEHEMVTRAGSYATVIKHMRILAFDAVTGTLSRQIVIPTGANAPTNLRLPWGKYYLVFAGNFYTLAVTEGTTMLNDVLVTMGFDPAYPGATDICVAPFLPYYYYKTGIVQFGIVGSIPVTLKPITSQIIFQYQNKPSYYKTLKADIRNIGRSLSLQGTSLGPAVRVIKSKDNLGGITGNVSDTTYTFSGIGSNSIVRLYATDNSNQVDSLDFTFKNQIMSGCSYKVYFIFPSAPELTAPKGLPHTGMFVRRNRLADIDVIIEDQTVKWGQENNDNKK